MTAAPGLRRTTRRTALKGVVAAACMAGAGGAVAWLRGRGYEPARERPSVSLTPWEVAVVGHVARRICASDRPSDASIPSSDEVDVVGFVDRRAGEMPAVLRRDLSRALLYLEQVAPLAAGLLSRFTRLSEPEQDRALSAMETSPVSIVRGAFSAIKSLVFMGYYSDPRAYRILGYEGPFVRPATGKPGSFAR